MSRIIVIAGITATGKTKLSISLAKVLNASIINADATNVYKEPLIATAKITEAEKEEITHYMMDLVSLNDDYSIYDYQSEGRKILDKLIKENKNIIVVGGSGLYIKALLYNYELNNNIKINFDYSKFSNEELKSMADNINKNDIHINNRKRLERYISYYKENNKPLSKTDNINERLYDFELIGLRSDKDKNYERINSRVEEMFNDGIIDEAKKLYDLKYKNFSNIIGYKELELYFNGNIFLEEAKELIKKNTRKYAKRQYTWFNNQMKDIKWFETDYNNFDNTIMSVKKYLNI